MDADPGLSLPSVAGATADDAGFDAGTAGTAAALAGVAALAGAAAAADATTTGAAAAGCSDVGIGNSLRSTGVEIRFSTSPFCFNIRRALVIFLTV